MNSTQYTYLIIIVVITSLAISTWLGIKLGHKYFKWRMRKKRPIDSLLTERYINMHKLNIYELRVLADEENRNYVYQICSYNHIVHMSTAPVLYAGALIVFNRPLECKVIEWYQSFEGVAFSDGDEVAITFQCLRIAKTINSKC
jgi:hypothetical protein